MKKCSIAKWKRDHKMVETRPISLNETTWNLFETHLLDIFRLQKTRQAADSEKCCWFVQGQCVAAVWNRYQGVCSLYDSKGGQNGAQLTTGYGTVYYERCAGTGPAPPVAGGGAGGNGPQFKFRGLKTIALSKFFLFFQLFSFYSLETRQRHEDYAKSRSSARTNFCLYFCPGANTRHNVFNCNTRYGP